MMTGAPWPVELLALLLQCVAVVALSMIVHGAARYRDEQRARASRSKRARMQYDPAHDAESIERHPPNGFVARAAATRACGRYSITDYQTWILAEDDGDAAEVLILTLRDVPYERIHGPTR